MRINSTIKCLNSSIARSVLGIKISKRQTSGIPGILAA